MVHLPTKSQTLPPNKKKYILQNPRGLVNFKKKFKLPKLPLFISLISKILLSFDLFSFFPPSIKTNHFSPPKEKCKNNFSNIQIKTYI